MNQSNYFYKFAKGIVFILLIISFYIYSFRVYEFFEYYRYCIHPQQKEENSIIDFNFFINVIKSNAFDISPPFYEIKKSKPYNKEKYYRMQAEIWEDIRLVSIINSYGVKKSSKQCNSSLYYYLSKDRYDYLVSLYKENNQLIEYMNLVQQVKVNIKNINMDIIVINNKFKYMNKLINSSNKDKK